MPFSVLFWSQHRYYIISLINRKAFLETKVLDNVKITIEWREKCNHRNMLTYSNYKSVLERGSITIWLGNTLVHWTRIPEVRDLWIFILKGMSNELEGGDHSTVDHRRPTWLEEKWSAGGKEDAERHTGCPHKGFRWLSLKLWFSVVLGRDQCVCCGWTEMWGE